MYLKYMTFLHKYIFLTSFFIFTFFSHLRQKYFQQNIFNACLDILQALLISLLTALASIHKNS